VEVEVGADGPASAPPSGAAAAAPPAGANRSMKISVPTMGPNFDFKQWKRNFLNFLYLKAT
jgi:hypothetical protein